MTTQRMTTRTMRTMTRETGTDSEILPQVDKGSLYPTEESRQFKLALVDRIKYRFERRWIRKQRRYFRQQRDMVLEAFKKFPYIPDPDTGRSGAPVETRFIPDDWIRDLFEAEDEPGRWVEEFSNLQIGVITSMGDETMKELGKAGIIADTVGFDIAHPEIQQWLADDLSVRSRLINDSTARQLQTLINNAVAEGKGSAVIRSRIAEKFNTISRGRTIAIARTEVGRAANISQYQAFRQSGVEKKEWISARDGDVRDSHISLDGQVRDMNEDFSIPAPNDNAGATAPQPMAFGIPGEDINCRCTMAPIIDPDDEIPAWDGP